MTTISNQVWTTFLAISFATGLSACAMDTTESSKIAPTRNEQGQLTNNIDRNYSLTYSEGTGQMAFLGTFTLSGTWFTTVKLMAPAGLSVNGRPIADRELMSKDIARTAGLLLPVLSPFFFLASGTHYHANLNSALAQTHAISFTDQTGKVFNDQMRVYPASISAPTTAGRGVDYVATMGGAPAPGENSFSIRIEQRNANGDLVIVSGSTSYGSAVRISAADMARLSAGPATVYGERSVRTRLNSAGSGSASGNSVYQTRPVGITVY